MIVIRAAFDDGYAIDTRMSRWKLVHRAYTLLPTDVPLHRLATEIGALGAFLTLCFVLASSACSLVVDKNATQCVRDQDCRVAPFSVCSAEVCSDPKALGTGGGDGSCADASGCYRCAPRTSVQFLNACSDRSCIPFDNASRLHNLAADGKLKPLLRQ